MNQPALRSRTVGEVLAVVHSSRPSGWLREVPHWHGDSGRGRMKVQREVLTHPQSNAQTSLRSIVRKKSDLFAEIVKSNQHRSFTASSVGFATSVSSSTKLGNSDCIVLCIYLLTPPSLRCRSLKPIIKWTNPVHKTLFFACCRTTLCSCFDLYV